MDVPVNYWAILVCGLASMVLGSLWYGPLFGKMWQEMMSWQNVDEAKKQEMMKSMGKSYTITLIGSLIMAYIFSHFLTFSMSYMNVEGVMAGLSSGFWAWLGFIAPVTLSTVLWDGKPWKLWFLSNGYNLILLLIFGAILSSWR